MVASGWKLVKVIIYYNEITHEMHDINFPFIFELYDNKKNHY